MSLLELDWKDLEKLETAMRAYQGNVEDTVNDVLHNEAGQLIHDEIKRLIPTSDKTWKDKKAAAKKTNSLAIVGGELSVTVTTKKAYQYLYFPDDGTNTYRHVGNQRFFASGGENQKEEIINRCIKRLVNGLKDAIN